jgi:hypothetical protein
MNMPAVASLEDLKAAKTFMRQGSRPIEDDIQEMASHRMEKHLQVVASGKDA